MHQIKPALKIVKELKISREKFWYLVLDVYTKNKEFDSYISLCRTEVIQKVTNLFSSLQ